MFKLSAILLLAFAVYYSHCLPKQTTKSDTNAVTEQKVQFYINNGTEQDSKDIVDEHLASAIHHLEVEDQEINAQLNAVLPYLNFLFDPHKELGLEDCLEQLEIQLVYGN